MISLLHAELRKLLTIRSTYVVSMIGLLLIGFLSFYMQGYRWIGPDSERFGGLMFHIAELLPTFAAIVAILVMAHEYRHNLIVYTLTIANSRTKVLISKILVILGYTVVFGLVAAAFGAAMCWLGVQLSNDPRNVLGPQTFAWGDIAWRYLYYFGAYALLGLLLTVLFRHVVGAIAFLFIVPGTVEALAGFVLKENAKYLPFSALRDVLSPTALSSSQGALLFAAYLLVAWIAAWLLFLRRDAS